VLKLGTKYIITELCLNECVSIDSGWTVSFHINSLLMCNQSLHLPWTLCLMNRWGGKKDGF